MYTVARQIILAFNLRDFSQSIKITNSEATSGSTATRTDCTIASCVGAGMKLLAYRSGSWIVEELGSTYGNLISDNRSCRRHKPT